MRSGEEYTDQEIAEQEAYRHEIDEYNKNIPEFILVNEENYYDLLMSSEKKTFNSLLGYGYLKYREELTNDQIISIVNRFPDTTEYMHFRSLEVFSIKVDEKNPKKDFENLICKSFAIQDKELQSEFINKILKSYETISIDEKYDIFEKLIKSENIIIENKYMLLSEYFERYNLDDEEIQNKKEELFRYVNSLAGKENYNEFLNVESYHYSRLIKNFYSDKVYETFNQIYDSNHNVLKTLTPELFNEETLNKLDYSLIEFYSRYVNYTSYNEIFKDKNKTDIFIDVYNRLKKLKTYPEEDLLRIISVIKKSNIDYESMDVGSIDKLISISQSNEDVQFYNMESFSNYDQTIKDKSREVIELSIASRRQLLDALGKRFFNLSYNEMKDYVIKYGEDLNYFLDQYEEKQDLTVEEQREFSALKTIRNLKEILEIKDKDAIRNTYHILDKDEEFSDIDFTGRIVLDENVKRVFAKDYLKDLYEPKESDKRIIDGVEVYSPKEFNMFVHVVGAYSNFKLVDQEHPEKSAVEAWNSNENKQSHIMCTSYIRNTNLSYAKIDKHDEKKGLIKGIKNIFSKRNEKKDIILGFKVINQDAIQMSSSADIAIVTNEIESQKAFRNYTFRTADNLSNCTRIMYNEVDIERRLADNRTNNIQPSYVICFDEITEESRKVAKDFGIPIIYLDNREIAERESIKLNEMFKEYDKTKDAKLLKRIIVQYQNNITSFSFRRKDLIQEFFNADDMNNKVRQIIENLVNECDGSNAENAIDALVVLQEALNDEIANYDYGNIDASLVSKNEFQIKEISFEIKSKLEEVRKVNKSFEENSDSSRFKVDTEVKTKEDSMIRKIRKSRNDYGR